MSSAGTTVIQLTARRRVGGTVVGVVRAAMDEGLGIPVAELHVTGPGREGQRLVVREGQNVLLGESAYRVVRIVPYSGRSPAGVTLSGVNEGGRRSEELG